VRKISGRGNAGLDFNPMQGIDKLLAARRFIRLTIAGSPARNEA
jgi:hypothetical protein